jgi:2-desacetyl-2-hydroxyethyl bacteriochlorophyllide A dehydrogenase
MKAAVFKSVGQAFVIESVRDPEPGRGQVVVRVARCGICSSDLAMTDGSGWTYPIGSVLGHEIAGEVVALGAQVQDLAVGDRIVSMGFGGCGLCKECLAGSPIWCSQFHVLQGGYAEFTTAMARFAVRLPLSLSMADGALVEPLAVARHGVMLARMEPGARVVVIGAGPIGLGAAFWANRLGAGRVVMVATSRRAAPLAEHMGAYRLIVSTQTLASDCTAALGAPPDIVFVCAGALGVIDDAIQVVRNQGEVIVMGYCMQRDSIHPSVAVRKEIRLQFSMSHSLRDIELSAAAMDDGAVEPRAMISDTITLDRLPAVFESLRSRDDRCKVHVDPCAK